MGAASLEVRFPDGTIRHGIYDGTSDFACPPLYETSDEAWEVDRNDRWGSKELHAKYEGMAGAPVEIYTNYGGGFWWLGKAFPDFITHGRDPYEVEHYDGFPEWFEEEA